MPRLECLSCRYKITVSRREAEFGMTCPECHCGRMVDERKERKEKRLTTLRANTVRSLVGGVFCLFTGPLVLTAGLANLSGKTGYLWARAVSLGVLLIIAAVILLIVAAVGLYRDLK